MGRRNGFLTVYVLVLGLMALTITLGASTACRSYLANARNYASSVRLTYAAESMLYTAWEELTAVPPAEMKATKRWYATDTRAILEPTDQLELYWVATIYTYPYKGTLWAIVYDTQTHGQRTSSLRFQIAPDPDGGPPVYTVWKQQY